MDALEVECFEDLRSLSDANQTDGSSSIFRSSITDRDIFAVLKETHILRVLRGLHQNLAMVLRVVLQGVSTTTKRVPELSFYNFHFGKSQELIDLGKN